MYLFFILGQQLPVYTSGAGGGGDDYSYMLSNIPGEMGSCCLPAKSHLNVYRCFAFHLERTVISIYNQKLSTDSCHIHTCKRQGFIRE